MVPKSLVAKTLAAASSIFFACSSHAMIFEYSGEIFYNVDIGEASFSLSSVTHNIRISTTSYDQGKNFDPVLGLWQQDGSDYKLVAVDDDASQTDYDSALAIRSLGAGNYLITVGAYPNFPYSSMISDGFALTHDGTQPTLLSAWCEPGQASCALEKGGFWSVTMETNGAPIPGVPEPATWPMLALGVTGLGFFRRRSARNVQGV